MGRVAKPFCEVETQGERPEVIHVKGEVPQEF
jgi:hypothetical protein